MPSKNCLKSYAENNYYHIYNRGVEKRNVFKDRRDYLSFLFYLRLYFSPVNILLKKKLTNPCIKRIRLDISKVSLFGKVELLAYCLMPNHFHLLVYQKIPDGITKLMRQLGTAYSMVFNRRHNRIGPLFQGRYKAVLVKSDEQLLHLSRYIHQNPRSLGQDSPVQLEKYPFSSLPQYLGHYQTSWLKPQRILDFFHQNNSENNYASFVKEKSQLEDNLF